MHRVDTSGHVSNRFDPGNPATGQQATLIGHDWLKRLVERAQTEDIYHKPLSSRADLDAALAFKLAAAVAKELQERLIGAYDLDRAAVEQAAGFAASDAAEDLSGQSPDDGAVDEDNQGQRREIRQMIEILRRKEWPHFEAAMVRFAGLPAALTHAILAERDGRKFTVLCRACNVTKSDFASLFLLSRRATPDVEVVDAVDVQDALALYDGITRPAAAKVVARWRAKAAKRSGFGRFAH